jgi:hypothetical protein
MSQNDGIYDKDGQRGKKKKRANYGCPEAQFCPVLGKTG